MIMVILPSFLGVELQTTSHCKVRHEDQAMGPASGEDIFVGSFEFIPSKTEQTSSSLEDIPRPHPQLSTEEERMIAMGILLAFLGLKGQTPSSLITSTALY